MQEPHSDSLLSVPSRYITYRKIRDGGNAQVTLAWDTVDGAWRAIKSLLPEYAKRAPLRNRFEREGKTMVKLDHPNIIRVYDAVSDNENAYLVMEYAEGGSVIDWLDRHNRPMPPRMVAAIGIDVCKGVQAAHDLEIIHRDIKPQNILVDRHGRCRVTDFGIAQATADPRMTMTGTVMGTVGYMAPEQHESAKHADARSDIYSIAAMLYTLVHGEAAHHLFMAEDRDFQGIPRDLIEVIRRGAKYRREERYSTVSEMQQALQRILDRLPADPPDTPPLVAPDQLLPDDTPAPEPRGRRPGFSDSVEPQQHKSRSRDTTPSSIIPRNSLTGSFGPSRRPRVQNREELYRAERRRQLLYSVGLVFAGVLVVLVFLSMWGYNKVLNAEAFVESADAELEKGLDASGELHVKLGRLPYSRVSEFYKLQDDILESEGDERRTAMRRLLDRLDNLEQELAYEPDKADIYNQVKESRRKLESLEDDVLARLRDVEATRTSFPGSMSGAVEGLVNLFRSADRLSL